MKIKEEQLKVIQKQQIDLNNITRELGLLEIQKHELLHRFATIQHEVEEVKAQLAKEYGDININVETGEYTEIEKEPELSKVD
jgi:vacuolar-type H+-ATPase subunit D/Vma8